MKIAIIGAGPSGLDTATQLKRHYRDLDITLYDLRAGHYSRPGLLDRAVFVKASTRMGYKTQPWEKRDGNHHIKDLEDFLYAEAIQLGIKFEEKRFEGLHHDPEHPAIIVTDAEGVRKLVLVDEIFDCTGSQRLVVKAINALFPEAPMKSRIMAEIPIPDHFIAYGNMAQKDIETLHLSFGTPLSAQQYTKALVQLRKLGWQHFKLPRCIAHSFHAEKVCLYIHAPSDLKEDNYLHWVHAVLAAYAPEVTFALLPPSKKPRFHAFEQTAERLELVSFKGPGLIRVTAEGDAQADADYALGHGILNSMDRVDLLIRCFSRVNGKLVFDADKYNNKVSALLDSHEADILKETEEVTETLADAEQKAEAIFKAAWGQLDTGERKMVEVFVRQIRAHQMLSVLLQKLQSLLDGEDSSCNFSEASTLTQLENIYKEANTLLVFLPPYCKIEQENISSILLIIASLWRKAGQYFFTPEAPEEAESYYHRVLEIHHNQKLSIHNPMEELQTYVQLIQAYFLTDKYSDLISIIPQAFFAYQSCSATEPKSQSMYQEIVYYHFATLAFMTNNADLLGQFEEGKAHLLEGKRLLENQRDVLNSEALNELLQMLEESQASSLPIQRSSELSTEASSPRSLVPSFFSEPSPEQAKDLASEVLIPIGLEWMTALTTTP